MPAHKSSQNLGLEIHKSLISIYPPTNKQSLSECINVANNTICFNAKMTNFQKMSFEIIRYSLIKGWLRKESLGDVIQCYNTLFDNRIKSHLLNPQLSR